MRKKATTASTKTAVGYVRVSTPEQAEHGISLEAQEERIRAYAILRGLDLRALVTDARVSAGKYTLAEWEGGR
jgi:DNA invertase Pin-like site-specific DNA recombinase